MDELELPGGTVPTPFNQKIEKRLVDNFYKRFDETVLFAAANDLRSPKKGDFASYIVLHGLKTFTVEDYFKNA